MPRTTLYKTAVIVHALSSLAGIFLALPALLKGPDAAGFTQGIPQTVIVLGALLGAAGLVSAYGAWQGQKWGVWLSILAQALNGLSALPGVFFAPNQGLRASAIVGVVIAIFVIAVLLRQPAPAVATD